MQIVSLAYFTNVIVWWRLMWFVIHFKDVNCLDEIYFYFCVAYSRQENLVDLILDVVL